MHIFLTGEVQVGKSTLIDRILDGLPGVTPAGFRSVTRPEFPDSFGSVFLVGAADRAPTFSAKNRVGIRRGHGRGTQGFPEIFDRCGIELLRGAENSRLILMDEIGRMEADAAAFCRRVTQLLDGDTPVLGVLRLRDATPLQETIRNHPRVRLVTVTAENRDALAEELLPPLRSAVARRTDSAGAIVLRESAQGTQVLMLRSGAAGWAFPKGHLERGESAEEAALREVREETGLTVALRQDFCCKAPSALAEERREVRYFLASPVCGTLAAEFPDSALPAWQSVTDAEALLRFPEDIPPFRAALEAYKKSLTER